jgi:hypothetical protein
MKSNYFITLILQEVNRRYKLLLRLLDTRSHLSLENKLLIYKTILKPMWMYELELWGSAKPSNLKRIQTLQSRILRKITNAPFYVFNHTLHKDLSIPFVHDLAIKSYNKFHDKLNPHPNPLVQNLSQPHLLKKLWPRDLIQQEWRHWSEFFTLAFVLTIKFTSCLICTVVINKVVIKKKITLFNWYILSSIFSRYKFFTVLNNVIIVKSLFLTV